MALCGSRGLAAGGQQRSSNLGRRCPGSAPSCSGRLLRLHVAAAFQRPGQQQARPPPADLVGHQSLYSSVPHPASLQQPLEAHGQSHFPTQSMGRQGPRPRRSFDGFEDEPVGDAGNWLLVDMQPGGFYDDPPPPVRETRQEPKKVNGKRVLVNKEIREALLNGRTVKTHVRVLGADREEIGVMTFSEASAIAMQENIDLVLVTPDADPPVCRLVQFSKYKYEQEKAAQAKQKANKGIETKEVRMRPVTETHDYQVKLKNASKFLSKGNRVKLSMSFNGRELRFKDQGKELMLKFIEDLGPTARVDGPLNFKTSIYTVMLAPAK